MRNTMNMIGPTTTQSPARKTYAHPTPKPRMMMPITDTHPAPNEHRTRLLHAVMEEL
ncbi:hypothetical protein BDY19DRAFT_912178, partial [Irpex rosettiformis]